MSAPDLKVKLGKLTLPNPVMVASGTFGYGKEYDGILDVGLLGAVVTKGVSLAPRQGNPPPRIAETPCGMLNSIGLENPGVEAFVRDKLPWLRQRGVTVIVNVFGNTVDEYARVVRRLDPEEGVCGFEVNISCPNVKMGGIAFGSDATQAALVSRAVRESTKKTVLVKLSPNVTDLVEIASRVAETGVDGLTLINTLRAMAIDPVSGRMMLGNKIGGLSGPAIRPVAIRAVYEVSRALKLPIVGAGGIGSYLDAVEFLRAGASAVQVGSATFRNPRAAAEVLQGLIGFLEEKGLDTHRALIGAVTEAAPLAQPARGVQR